MEAKILAAVTAACKKSEGLYVHLLASALKPSGPQGELSSLRIARASASPFWLCDLPAAIFSALIALTQARKVSLCTVSAQAAALAVEEHPQPFPLISLAESKSKAATFFLPMRLVLGAPPGSGGFSLVGEDASRFDWHGAAPGGGGGAAKKAKKAAPAAPPKKRAPPSAAVAKKRAAAAKPPPRAKPAAKKTARK